jgi:hypothetical protein
MLRTVLTSIQAIAAVTQFGLIALLLTAAVPSVFGFESFVHEGDLAVVAPIKASEVALGDTLVYRRPADPDTVVVARVLYVDLEGDRVALQTRGSSDAISDQVSLTPRTTIGRLAYRLPRLGVLVELMNQTPGRVLLLGVPCVIFATSYLRSRRRPVSDNSARANALVAAGRRALAAGHAQLALKAADGALTLDPLNNAAPLLRAQAQQALRSDVEHVAA